LHGSKSKAKMNSLPDLDAVTLPDSLDLKSPVLVYYEPDQTFSNGPNLICTRHEAAQDPTKVV
jgi:hypothetical protein